MTKPSATTMAPVSLTLRLVLPRAASSRLPFWEATRWDFAPLRELYPDGGLWRLVRTHAVQPRHGCVLLLAASARHPVLLRRACEVACSLRRVPERGIVSRRAWLSQDPP